ncbi:MAG: DUF4339 domain-containing protein [Planctomycetota bacterium]
MEYTLADCSHRPFRSDSMGIRFSCHDCGIPLNIKHELAGKRGVCPKCQVRFRIPKEDAATSIPLESSDSVSSDQPKSAHASVSDPVADLATTQAAVAAATKSNTTPAAEQSVTGPLASSSQANGVGPAQQQAGGPELLADDAEATWYVRPPSGGQYGPATTDVLHVWIKEGRVARTALLWRDGWPQWREASEALADIADQLPSPVAPASHDVFQSDDSRTRKTRSFAQEETSRLGYPITEQASLSGDSSIGTTRKKRNTRRIATMVFLAVLVITLIIVLLVVAGGGE